MEADHSLKSWKRYTFDVDQPSVAICYNVCIIVYSKIRIILKTLTCAYKKKKMIRYGTLLFMRVTKSAVLRIKKWTYGVTV